MNNWQSISFSLIVCVLAACAAERLPAFVPAPEPPAEWDITSMKNVGCPNATGQYELIPRVAELQKTGTWNVSNGKWYDFILLVPSDRVTAEKWTPNKASTAYSDASLIVESEQDGRTLRVTSPNKNGEQFSTRVFSTAENDYKCKDGNIIFPEFHIQGGTEGAYLNGKIFRQASMTLDGDLLFYEQVQSHKSIHRYYLCKLKDK